MASGHLRFLHLETLHHVFPGDIHELTNGLPQLPHTFSQRAEVQIPWQDYASPPSVGGTNNKLLSKGLAAALHPGR